MKRLALALLAALAAGCGPRYQSITFTLLNNTPVPVVVDDDAIEIPVGIAASIKATLHSSSMIEYDQEALDLDSQDRGVLAADPGPGARTFVLTGVAVGETCLSVEVEFAEEDCIPVRVTAAPP